MVEESDIKNDQREIGITGRESSDAPPRHGYEFNAPHRARPSRAPRAARSDAGRKQGSKSLGPSPSGGRKRGAKKKKWFKQGKKRG